MTAGVAQVPARDIPHPVSLAEKNALRLRCPACGRSSSSLVLEGAELPSLTCPSCRFVISQKNGIWRALTPTREEHFQRFMVEYETIRTKEGRGSTSEQFYLALPYRDTTRRNTWQWSIRGRSFRFLLRSVLPKIEAGCPDQLSVLDIGAGNCWMSYQFALRGHRSVAVDLSVNDLDGLGAGHHYSHHLPRPFDRFQAEMDRLPFEDGQFDLAIFNASFHYSEDYERTLQETLRCLRRPGNLLIVDSPFYHKEESGLAMLEERHREFEKRFGFRSDALASRGFLTSQTLDQMARRFGLQWRILKPWHGLGWFLRPYKARLLRRREPAKFLLFWAHLGAA